MKKLMLAFICLFILSEIVSAQSADEKKIRELMSAQDAAWNRGDLESFMQTYWQSDSLMFIGKNGVTYGWKNTLDNYKKSYPDTAAMGKLHFEYVEMKQLSPEYFFVVGKWFLTRTIGDLRGAFTLLLKKVNNNWVIIRDHSS